MIRKHEVFVNFIKYDYTEHKDQTTIPVNVFQMTSHNIMQEEVHFSIMIKALNEF